LAAIDTMKDEPKSNSEIVLYQTEDGRTRLEVRLENESVWLSLNQLAELFQRDKSVVSRHIKNVFDEGELQPAATVAKCATVQTEGAKQVSRDIEFYNLDVIISVGYREFVSRLAGALQPKVRLGHYLFEHVLARRCGRS
jgi:hypothetical protein